MLYSFSAYAETKSGQGFQHCQRNIYKLGVAIAVGTALWAIALRAAASASLIVVQLNWGAYCCVETTKLGCTCCCTRFAELAIAVGTALRAIAYGGDFVPSPHRLSSYRTTEVGCACFY